MAPGTTAEPSETYVSSWNHQRLDIEFSNRAKTVILPLFGQKPSFGSMRATSRPSGGRIYYEGSSCMAEHRIGKSIAPGSSGDATGECQPGSPCNGDPG